MHLFGAATEEAQAERYKVGMAHCASAAVAQEASPFEPAGPISYTNVWLPFIDGLKD